MHNTREILNDCNEFFTISNLFEMDLRFTDDVSFMYHYEIYAQQFPDIMENIYSFIDLRLSDFLLVLPQDDDFSEYLSFFSKKPKVSMKYAIISYLEANDTDKLFADKTIRNAYVEISGSLDSEIIDIIKELYENGFKKTKKYWYMDIKKRHPRIYFVREFLYQPQKNMKILMF